MTSLGGDLNMYVLLGYEILKQRKVAEFSGALDNILEDYDWQQLTKGLYFISMVSKAERNKLESNLTAIGRAFQVKFDTS